MRNGARADFKKDEKISWATSALSDQSNKISLHLSSPANNNIMANHM
jgi:hypothetical protein